MLLASYASSKQWKLYSRVIKNKWTEKNEHFSEIDVTWLGKSKRAVAVTVMMVQHFAVKLSEGKRQRHILMWHVCGHYILVNKITRKQTWCSLWLITTAHKMCLGIFTFPCDNLTAKCCSWLAGDYFPLQAIAHAQFKYWPVLAGVPKCTRVCRCLSDVRL